MPAHTPRVGFVSLGCPKALVDSERILTQLRAEGYDVVGNYEDANLVVVNTCGFIDDAVTESLDAIGEAIDRNGRVIVTGCLGARAERIREAHPKVLAISGPHRYEEVLGHVHQHLPKPHDPYQDLLPPQGVRLTPRHYAYLKISEGCNHRCTFCIIPSMRGDLVSRPVGEVLTEAEKLVEAGVKELLVISQDTSAYGVDLRYRPDIWRGQAVKTRMTELCRALGTLGVWVRLHYVYPYPHVDEVLPLMADGHLLPYLDVPFQHASPRILKAMKRPAHAEDNLARIRRWREICPELAVRSTFIVGFPGETEDDFEQLLEFLEAARIDRAGCFMYSPVEGARANDLAAPVPAEIMQERYQRFMTLQARISAENLQARVGREMTVLVDSMSEDEDGVPITVARSHADAPDIDGNVLLHAVEAPPGEFIEVLVEDADEHDLWARPLDIEDEEDWE